VKYHNFGILFSSFLVLMSLICQFMLGVMFILFLQAIAIEVKSESKWKQLGELAMSTGNVFFSPVKRIYVFGVFC